MKENQSNIAYIAGITFVATLGGLLFGYDTAVISGAEGSLEEFFANRLDLGSWAKFIHGVTTSSALIGCVIGSALSGYFAGLLGQKKSLIFTAVLFVITALGSAFPEFLFFTKGEASVGLLLAFNFYRIIGGIAIGLASAICPMYIAEISPAHLRGRLVSFNQFAIIFGMLVVYFVNWGITNGKSIAWINDMGWRMMFVSASVPAILFGVLLFFVPDSPRELAFKSQEGKALDILSKINGAEKARSILAEIKGAVEESGNLFSYGSLVLVIGILLSIFQQFVGINVVLYYAPRIFESMVGGSKDVSMLQTVIMGFVNIVFTVVAILTVDKFGRKPLLLIGSVGMAIGMFAIGILSFAKIIGVSTLIFIIIYTASFMMSWGPICWVLIAEIFPNKIRGQAIAIAVAAQWIANFLVSSTFPPLINFSEGGTYILYGVMSVLSFVFVWILVPETKGKTLEEIEKIWTQKS